MKVEDVDGLVRRLDAQRLFLQGALKAIRGARSGQVWDVVALSNALKDVADSPQLFMDLRSVVIDSQRAADEAAATKMLELERDIRDLCQTRGWRIDGQWPTLIVERAIEVRVEPTIRAVTVAGRKVIASAYALERPLAENVANLIPRGFDPNRFIENVAEAYDHAALKKGGELPILQVYRTMVILLQSARFWKDAQRTAFSELTSAQFCARLSAALEAKVTNVADGRELRLLPPIDPKDSMFVYQPAESRFGYVGRIEFRKN